MKISIGQEGSAHNETYCDYATKRKITHDTDGAISGISRVLAIGLWWGERLELSTSASKRAHHPMCKIVCEAFVFM